MQKENIMGTAKIPNLIMRMSLPMMLSMLVQALYNVVDSIFVARYSADALTAVSLAFPLQNLIIAFAVGTGVGVNSVLARRLGEKRHEDADKAASTGIFLALVTYVVFALAGLALAKPFLAMFTSDATLLDLSTQYAMICMCFSLGCFVDIMGERILQATGDSFHPMIIQGAGAITNIILDPIFIFTFDMGVAGAAIATVIGQWVSMFLAIYWVRKNSYVHVRMRRLKPSARLIRDIYAVGAPTIVMNSVSTVLVSALNGILIRFSNMAVSVFGVYFKLQSFVFMPVFGLNNGLIPILAFNYGAMSRKRMTSAMKYGIVIAVAIMLVGTLIFQLYLVPLAIRRLDIIRTVELPRSILRVAYGLENGCRQFIIAYLPRGPYPCTAAVEQNLLPAPVVHDVNLEIAVIGIPLEHRCSRIIVAYECIDICRHRSVAHRLI